MTSRHPVKRAAFLASACLVAFTAPAQPDPRPGARDTAELQRQFWRCDHAATRALLDLETAARCSRVTEALRQRRFGDDFPAFLAWWRANKAAEHAALDTGAAATAAARPAPGPAAPPARPLDDATPEQLKAAYLHCDRLATTEDFDPAAAMACSIVYEALKARVFGGSTERVIAWMKQQQATLADRTRPGRPR
ncbi:MAG: hypothetical protein KIT17_14865 [Rubrivivax sp.]|nr:hypothetical protein [Rubrivivax sp.]